MGMMAERQQAAHKMIARWGGTGQLIRNGTPRNAVMARMEYTPKERASLAIDAETRIRVSAYKLAVPPDFDLDIISFQGKNYKILLPPDGPSSDGATFAFYDCAVVGTALG